MTKLTLALFTVLLISCQKAEFETHQWQRTGAEGDAPPIWVYDQDFIDRQTELHVGQERIRKKVQRMSGIEVENSELTVIRNSQGQNLWAAQQRASREHLSLLPYTELLSYRMRPTETQDKIKRRLSRESLEILEQPRLVVAARRGAGFHPELRFSLSRTSTGDLFEDSYDLRGNRLSRQQVGAHFPDTAAYLAQVYPKGPKRSQLTWVPLFLAKNSQALRSDSFSVHSQSGNQVDILSERLSYSLDDARFDQIQVYYYIEDFLNRLQSEHGLRIPFPLQVETHIGWPEQTNAAFYYRWMIRFGMGDGLTYNQLMRDPTIIVHEVAHAVIDSLSRLEFTGEAGAINEGFADFISASSLNTPYMAEDSYVSAPYRRSLTETRDFNSREGKLYEDSQIVSSFFWSLRSQIGAKTTEDLALRLIARLLPNSGFTTLRDRMIEIVETLPEAEKQKTKKLMSERGWI